MLEMISVCVYCLPLVVVAMPKSRVAGRCANALATLVAETSTLPQYPTLTQLLKDARLGLARQETSQTSCD